MIDELGDDGIVHGGADLDDNRKNHNSSDSAKNKQAAAEDSNSFDLDNSDDLNRFI